MANEKQEQQEQVEQPPQLTEEDVRKIKKQQLGADFALGRDTKHLRLPEGLPK